MVRNVRYKGVLNRLKPVLKIISNSLTLGQLAVKKNLGLQSARQTLHQYAIQQSIMVHFPKATFKHSAPPLKPNPQHTHHILMAKFIPPLIADYKYDGEQHIAQRIQDDAATANWVVLHSLDVAAHRSQMLGECDFVIIVPGKGVLCLEVKGCKSLRVTDGCWYYGVNPKADRRGPFKQAADAMFSIRNFLFQKHPAWRNTVFFTSAVVFPFINFTVSAPGLHQNGTTGR